MVGIGSQEKNKVRSQETTKDELSKLEKMGEMAVWPGLVSCLLSVFCLFVCFKINNNK